MNLIIPVISLFLLASYCGLIAYYRHGWVAFPPAAEIPGEIPRTSISVIIPARNEEKNIAACLDSILVQDFPAALLQVIVIDDHSTDRTNEIAAGYKEKNVTVISLAGHISGTINSYKKKAVELAIQKSTGEIIIGTDADCLVPPMWLKTIVSFYKQNKAKFIAMPVAYTNNGSLGNIFQSLDFLSLQGITAASHFLKLYSMCNGANIAYSRQAFYDVGGFGGIDELASGDDMLLMQKIAAKYPDDIYYLKSSDVIVKTSPMHSVRSFLNQRIRWASKASHYKEVSIKIVLGAVYFFNLWLLLLPLAALTSVRPGLFNHNFSIMLLWIAMIAVKTATELIFLFPVAKFYGRQKILWWFPLAQPFHIIYTVVAGWFGQLGTYAWKGRTVK